jgi:hypothetical protein
MGEACGSHARGEVHTAFWLGGLKDGDHWEDLGVDGRITSRWILGKWVLGMWMWIHLAQDRDTWRALVNTVISLWIP